MPLGHPSHRTNEERHFSTITGRDVFNTTEKHLLQLVSMGIGDKLKSYLRTLSQEWKDEAKTATAILYVHTELLNDLAKHLRGAGTYLHIWFDGDMYQFCLSDIEPTVETAEMVIERLESLATGQ